MSSTDEAQARRNRAAVQYNRCNRRLGELSQRKFELERRKINLEFFFNDRKTACDEISGEIRLRENKIQQVWSMSANIKTGNTYSIGASEELRGSTIRSCMDAMEAAMRIIGREIENVENELSAVRSEIFQAESQRRIALRQMYS